MVASFQRNKLRQLCVLMYECARVSSRLSLSLCLSLCLSLSLSLSLLKCCAKDSISLFEQIKIWQQQWTQGKTRCIVSRSICLLCSLSCFGSSCFLNTVSLLSRIPVHSQQDPSPSVRLSSCPKSWRVLFYFSTYFVFLLFVVVVVVVVVREWSSERWRHHCWRWTDSLLYKEPQVAENEQ